MPPANPDWVNLSELRKRKLRYGFKADAKRQSIALRKKHGWSDHDPVDCFRLAELMGIRIVPVTSHGDCEAVRHVTKVEPNSFSAATLVYGDQICILLNDTHPPERQASNLAHEIGHVHLQHEGPPPLSETGCRELHAEVEGEANYFGSVLLAPDEAVIRLTRDGRSIPDAATYLGISTQMMQWRYNDSAAEKRLGRRERK